ncbi:MAG: SOS response-associated peptidase [Gammaproteobacteria bacterium]|jgi:putative SOS response-associated peptidase YedK
MCGRYITPEAGDIERHWDLVPADTYRQNFNTAPTQSAPVIRRDDDGNLVLHQFRWGFQPHWAKRAWVNARSETLFESRAFAPAAKTRRCLVPAVGWYEWQGSQAPKQPYVFHDRGFRPFAFAGIWTVREEESETVHNFAIVTRAAVPELARVHNRMPVLLRHADEDAWLSAETTPEAARSLLGEPEQSIRTYKVSTLVNKPANNDARCIVPLRADEDQV